MGPQCQCNTLPLYSGPRFKVMKIFNNYWCLKIHRCVKVVGWCKQGTTSPCILFGLRTLVKSANLKNNFRISQPKHMLWVLKRTASMRRFF